MAGGGPLRKRALKVGFPEGKKAKTGDYVVVDGGVPMEPFNLKQEREEGYFDADGNYVKYISEDIKDAWLDSVDANRKIAPRNYTEPKKQDDAVDLSCGNVAEIKRRIADVLEPGETVVQALRRLKGNSNNRKVKMSEESKQIFDQLTEDATRLLENGDYNVYDEKQETFHREAEGYEKLAEARKQAFTSSTVLDESEGYEKLAEARKQAFTSSTVLDNSSEDMFDMFADEDGSEKHVQRTGVRDEGNNGPMPRARRRPPVARRANNQPWAQKRTKEKKKLAKVRKQAFTSSTVVDNSCEDMFANEDGSAAAINPAASDMNDAAASNTAASNIANHQASESDRVYDETSGCYYIKSLGYYYDPSSVLYCYASTGQWYSFEGIRLPCRRFNLQSCAYKECQQQEAAAVSSS